MVSCISFLSPPLPRLLPVAPITTTTLTILIVLKRVAIFQRGEEKEAITLLRLEIENYECVPSKMRMSSQFPGKKVRRLKLVGVVLILLLHFFSQTQGQFGPFWLNCEVVRKFYL